MENEKNSKATIKKVKIEIANPSTPSIKFIALMIDITINIVKS